MIIVTQYIARWNRVVMISLITSQALIVLQGCNIKSSLSSSYPKDFIQNISNNKIRLSSSIQFPDEALNRFAKMGYRVTRDSLLCNPTSIKFKNFADYVLMSEYVDNSGSYAIGIIQNCKNRSFYIMLFENNDVNSGLFYLFNMDGSCSLDNIQSCMTRESQVLNPASRR